MTHPKPGVQERIMLHLRDYADYTDSVEVPFALSQMGIANAVAIARSNVPRAIAGLKDAIHLIERQAHVAGVSRKRKAYFLTDSGMVEAEKTWKRLSEHPVRLVDKEGASHTTTLAGSIDIATFPLRAVDVIRYMDDNGMLDLRTLNEELIQRDLDKHVEKQLVTSLGDLPRTRSFFGRETELENICALLDARSSCLLVPGIAGIGKTALAGKVIEQYTHRRNLLYHRCQDWEGSRAFLEACSEWLSTIGDDDLSDYIHATAVPQSSVAVNLIIGALEEIPSLIVIDDLHKINDDALFAIIRGLSQRMGDAQECGLVMFSRSFRAVVPLKDAEGKISALILPLDGLDQSASRNLLTTMPDIDMSAFLHIYTLSRGHPLILQLINRGSVGSTFHDTLETFVEEEIFSRLSGAEKRVLGAIAIYREPMPLEALSNHEIETDLLGDLVEKGLARQVDSENYDVHDLVREFLLRTFDTVIATELHAAACAWYRKRLDAPEQQLEYIYHLVNSGDTDSLGDVLEKHGRSLIRSGHMELLPLLLELEQSQYKSQTWAMILEMRGDILSLQGRWSDAESEYEAALPLVMDPPNISLEIQGRLLSSKADLAIQRDESDTALELHRQALQLFIDTGNAKGAARTYANMGYIFRHRKDTKRALEVYGNVEQLLEAEDDPELVEVRIKLASALLEMGEIDRAREHALSSYEETEGSENVGLHARSRAVLGRFYARTGDPDLALHHYSEALEQMAEESDQRSAVDITILLGEALSDAGRSAEAVEHYLDGLAMAEANDFRPLIGELLARLGEAAPEKSERMNYLQRALTVFRELGAGARMRDVQGQMHRAIMGGN
jgi:ATP/maltotriose-dependent transcriptional regulator MalT